MHGVLLAGFGGRPRAAGQVALPAAWRGPGAGMAGAAGDLMGADDVRVARVGRQRRLRPAGGPGAALGDAGLPHRWLPSEVVVPASPGSSRRTEIRHMPRSRILTRTPCSAGWSATRPEMIVSPAS